MSIDATLNTTAPVIDDELGLSLANNKPEVAEELLEKFVKHLPDSQQKINDAYQKQDLTELAHQVHRLHGACCYCGVPRLKEIVDTLESAIKLGKHHVVDKLVGLLSEAIEDVMEAYRCR